MKVRMRMQEKMKTWVKKRENLLKNQKQMRMRSKMKERMKAKVKAKAKAKSRKKGLMINNELMSEITKWHLPTTGCRVYIFESLLAYAVYFQVFQLKI